MAEFIIEIYHTYVSDNIPSNHVFHERVPLIKNIITDTIDDNYVFNILLDDVHVTENMQISLLEYKSLILNKVLTCINPNILEYNNCKFQFSVTLESECYDLLVVQQILRTLQQELIPFKSRGTITQLGIQMDDQFIGLYHVINNETLPTCLCYSLCLAYKRMKLYDNTIVIIEKRFQPIENKVEAILRKYLSIAFKNKVSTIPEWIFI